MSERKRKVVWEVIRLRACGEYIGAVSAPDQQSALKGRSQGIRVEAGGSEPPTGAPFPVNAGDRARAVPAFPPLRKPYRASGVAIASLKK
jgi:hypothetical protein